MQEIDKRQLTWALVALLAVVAAAFGLSLTQPYERAVGEEKTERAAAEQEQMEDACASAATYNRLKEVAFEEAVRIRNADPANLDTLATHSVVRMENPVVKSQDEALNVTVCTGTFILELPPGAERAFGGERRLTAEIEYSAQRAADGSGLVYQISGAEPIIYKLAAFDLQNQPVRVSQPEPESQPTDFAEAALPSPPPDEPAAAPPASAPRQASRPSFNCRVAGSPSERMVCSSERLAALDRQMSSQFYSALPEADRQARRRLRQTRDAFLAYRDRCPDEACVAEAYQGRMREIRDIMRESN